jgi:hypothetical protein
MLPLVQKILQTQSFLNAIVPEGIAALGGRRMASGSGRLEAIGERANELHHCLLPHKYLRFDIRPREIANATGNNY